MGGARQGARLLSRSPCRRVYGSNGIVRRLYTRYAFVTGGRYPNTVFSLRHNCFVDLDFASNRVGARVGGKESVRNVFRIAYILDLKEQVVRRSAVDYQMLEVSALHVLLAIYNVSRLIQKPMYYWFSVALSP